MKTKKEKTKSSLFYVKIMNMTKAQKILTILLSVLTCCSMISCIAIYRSIYVNPDKIEIKYKNLKSEKIPDEMKDKSVVFFTDFQYGKFQNKKRTKKFFSKLEHLDPDLFLFGGDLFDQSYQPTEADVQYMIKSLQKISSPLGKFAVLGEQDTFSPERKQLVERIYKESEIEILSNTNHPVSNQSLKGIQIIGMDTKPNWNQALANVKKDEFCILLTHMPDQFLSSELSRIHVDFALAGHSHGCQISFPITGGYKDIKGARDMNYRNGKKVPFDYYISSGVGCSQVNARLNADPEIVYILLK